MTDTTNDNIHEEAERAADLMTNNNQDIEHLNEADRQRVQESIKEKLITAHKTEGLDVKELADKLKNSLEKTIEENLERESR